MKKMLLLLIVAIFIGSVVPVSAKTFNTYTDSKMTYPDTFIRDQLQKELIIPNANDQGQAIIVEPKKEEPVEPQGLKKP